MGVEYKETLRDEKTSENFELSSEASLLARKVYPIINTTVYETQSDFDLGYKTAAGKKLKLLDDGVGFKDATANKVQKYNGSKLEDSSITDNGVNVGVNANLNVTGNLMVNGSAVSSFAEITKEPTGFTDPVNIVVTYDSTSRTITLTGDVEAYFNGQMVETLVSGWTSAPHVESPTAPLFLYYDGSAFIWSTTLWEFYYLQIAYVAFNSTGTFIIALRECHSLMPWLTHRYNHYTNGTVLESGGSLSSYVLDSNTAIDRRPDIGVCYILDEDLRTLNSALTSKLYAHYYLSGSSELLGTANLTVDNAEILPVSGSTIYYNQWNGSAWVQTAVSNGDYMNVYLSATQATADSFSQKRRYIFAQGQSVFTSLANARAESVASMKFGELKGYTVEIVFFAKIILYYTGGDWKIVAVDPIYGTRTQQIK